MANEYPSQVYNAQPEVFGKIAMPAALDKQEKYIGALRSLSDYISILSYYASRSPGAVVHLAAGNTIMPARKQAQGGIGDMILSEMEDYLGCRHYKDAVGQDIVSGQVDFMSCRLALAFLEAKVDDPNATFDQVIAANPDAYTIIRRWHDMDLKDNISRTRPPQFPRLANLISYLDNILILQTVKGDETLSNDFPEVTPELQRGGKTISLLELRGEFLEDRVGDMYNNNYSTTPLKEEDLIAVEWHCGLDGVSVEDLQYIDEIAVRAIKGYCLACVSCTYALE